MFRRSCVGMVSLTSVGQNFLTSPSKRTQHLLTLDLLRVSILRYTPESQHTCNPVVQTIALEFGRVKQASNWFTYVEWRQTSEQLRSIPHQLFRFKIDIEHKFNNHHTIKIRTGLSSNIRNFHYNIKSMCLQ